MVSTILPDDHPKKDLQKQLVLGFEFSGPTALVLWCVTKSAAPPMPTLCSRAAYQAYHATYGGTRDVYSSRMELVTNVAWSWFATVTVQQLLQWPFAEPPASTESCMNKHKAQYIHQATSSLRNPAQTVYYFALKFDVLTPSGKQSAWQPPMRLTTSHKQL